MWEYGIQFIYARTRNVTFRSCCRTLTRDGDFATRDIYFTKIICGITIAVDREQPRLAHGVCVGDKAREIASSRERNAKNVRTTRNLNFPLFFLLLRYFFVSFYLVNNFSLKIFAKLGLVGQLWAQLEILDCHAARRTVNWKPNCAAGVKHPKGKENVWTFFAVKKSSRQQKMWKIHIQLDEETTRERKIRESENVHFQHSRVELGVSPPISATQPKRVRSLVEDCDVTSAPTSKQTSTTPKDDNKTVDERKEMLKCHQSLQEGEAKKEEIAQRNNIRFYSSWMMLSNEESRGRAAKNDGAI